MTCKWCGAVLDVGQSSALCDKNPGFNRLLRSMMRRAAGSFRAWGIIVNGRAA